MYSKKHKVGSDQDWFIGVHDTTGHRVVVSEEEGQQTLFVRCIAE